MGGFGLFLLALAFVFAGAGFALAAWAIWTGLAVIARLIEAGR